MAINADIVMPDFLSHAARALGVDWIKVNNDRMFRAGDPDLVTEDSDGRKENFWCPEVTWSVGGKTYQMAVPVKTKRRRVSAVKFLWIEILPAWSGHEMDQLAMLDALAEKIKSTVPN